MTLCSCGRVVRAWVTSVTPGSGVRPTAGTWSSVSATPTDLAPCCTSGHRISSVRWEPLGPVSVGSEATYGQVWECPDFFALNGRHVLLYSVTPGSQSTQYALGSWDGRALDVADCGLLDLGPYYYAAQTHVGSEGERIVWGWIREGRTPGRPTTRGMVRCARAAQAHDPRRGGQPGDAARPRARSPPGLPDGHRRPVPESGCELVPGR